MTPDSGREWTLLRAEPGPPESPGQAPLAGLGPLQSAGLLWGRGCWAPPVFPFLQGCCCSGPVPVPCRAGDWPSSSQVSELSGPHFALVHRPTSMETTKMLAVGSTMTVGGPGHLLGGRGSRAVTWRLGVAVPGWLAHHFQSSHVPAPCVQRGSVPGTGQWRCPVRLSPCAIVSRTWTQPLVSVAASLPPLIAQAVALPGGHPRGVPASFPLWPHLDL